PALLRRRAVRKEPHDGRPNAVRPPRPPTPDGAAVPPVALERQEGSFSRVQDFAPAWLPPSRIFWSIAGVEWPRTRGIATTRPPAASTSYLPMILSARQSAPITRP